VLRQTRFRNGVTACGSQNCNFPVRRRASGYSNPNGEAVLSRCQPDATRWRDSPRSQSLWESQRICRRGDGGIEMIGMTNAEYAMGPRASVRYGCSARRRREKTDHESVKALSTRMPLTTAIPLRSRVRWTTLTPGSEAEWRGRPRRLG
jgi:hypothetical protein